LAVLADHSTDGQGPCSREGEAGYNVSLVRTMGDTQRSQIISSEHQRIAEQTVPGRVVNCCTPNAVSPVG